MVSLSRHPCFSGNCRPSTGRIHLPVAPVCNIRCRFCARGGSESLERPGNASRVVGPAEAMRILERALRICPELAVVGVSGPGDPLASDHAVELLELARARYPGLINCLSTNGLALPEFLPRLVKAGVGALTVTVNAISPAVLARLCAGVIRRGELIAGRAGAETLIAAQSLGIPSAKALGMGVKINMVLVPGLNEGQVEAVAAAAAGWGAEFMNVIPLLPAAGFAGLRPPSPEELETARRLAERHLPVLRHCHRCRADACGIPGAGDLAASLYRDPGPAETFSHG